MAGQKVLKVMRLGLVPYGAALRIQETLSTLRAQKAVPDTLLALEHPPVYTVGKRQTVHNLLKTPEELRKLGAEVFHIPRGGDVTFHGPGQVILYPILNLHESRLAARAFVEGLEDVMVETAGVYGVSARGRVPGETGVWVEDRKVGAVGVRISRGITTHGLALNANVDLGWFEHIVPCGIADKEVTSLEKETGGADIRMDDVMRESVRAFCRVFGYDSR
jgi:lipoate-protein ligase B